MHTHLFRTRYSSTLSHIRGYIVWHNVALALCRIRPYVIRLCVVWRIVVRPNVVWRNVIGPTVGVSLHCQQLHRQHVLIVNNYVNTVSV